MTGVRAMSIAAFASAVLLAPTLVLAADAGAALFAEHCAACHSPSGSGLPGFGPPLAGPAAARLKTPGGREYLAQVVVHGISGVFELAGQRQFAAMTPQAKLSDEELAAVLNYVLGQLNATALADAHAPITPTEITAARQVVRTPGELHKTKGALERAAR
jgi:mono/diheme cytochrome c family protein